MSWLTIKAKLIGAGAIALAVLGFFVRLKIVTAQRDRFKQNAKIYKAQAVQQTKINEADDEIAEQTVSRRAQLKRELDDEKIPDSISKPDDW